ncbi:hypothetical protein, partial [Mesorhizobium sp. M8A.F.Ca.ET.197.01.1.1]|uniref:hypothetical protein n=1 Tax=Mesorhizobium sp. M8A.F.Ca.ET.197.01.1.1 TaxID=2563965 RepID=UPI001AEE4981
MAGRGISATDDPASWEDTFRERASENAWSSKGTLRCLLPNQDRPKPFNRLADFCFPCSLPE